MHIFDQQSARAYMDAIMAAKTGRATENDQPSENVANESLWQFLIHLLKPTKNNASTEKPNR